MRFWWNWRQLEDIFVRLERHIDDINDKLDCLLTIGREDRIMGAIEDLEAKVGDLETKIGAKSIDTWKVRRSGKR